MAANQRYPKQASLWPPTWPDNWTVSEVTDPCELTEETEERRATVEEARRIMEQHETARKDHLQDVVDAARALAVDAIKQAMEHPNCGLPSCCKQCTPEPPAEPR